MNLNEERKRTAEALVELIRKAQAANRPSVELFIMEAIESFIKGEDNRAAAYVDLASLAFSFLEERTQLDS